MYDTSLGQSSHTSHGVTSLPQVPHLNTAALSQHIQDLSAVVHSDLPHRVLFTVC